MAAALPGGMFVISSVVAYRRDRSFARFKQARLPGGGRFVGACGGEKSPKGDGLYAYPAGASFCTDKRIQKRFRAAP